MFLYVLVMSSSLTSLAFFNFLKMFYRWYSWNSAVNHCNSCGIGHGPLCMDSCSMLFCRDCERYIVMSNLFILFSWTSQGQPSIRVDTVQMDEIPADLPETDSSSSTDSTSDEEQEEYEQLYNISTSVYEFDSSNTDSTGTSNEPDEPTIHRVRCIKNSHVYICTCTWLKDRHLHKEAWENNWFHPQRTVKEWRIQWGII